MKLQLLNTVYGLVPLYDSDYDDRKKLNVGEIYTAEIRLARNVMFHRKYFSLIRTAWEFLPERIQEHYHNSWESFRKSVEIAAGWYEEVYSITRNEWLQVSKSISFSSMDNDQFSELYERVKDVLFRYYLNGIINEQDFENKLLTY